MGWDGIEPPTRGAERREPGRGTIHQLRGLGRGPTPVSGTELKQRLAAILAADVAGYSRLMAADERATVAALDVARATGAVSAALAIQQRLTSLCADVPDERRMRFGVGVHLGDVIEKGRWYRVRRRREHRCPAARPGHARVHHGVEVDPYLYWLTNAAASSARIYWETAAET